MADSARAVRRSIYEWDILSIFRNWQLTEISPDDMRAMCAQVRGCGAATIAVYVCAILHLVKGVNPAAEVELASITTVTLKRPLTIAN